ncbi:MAG TPA: alanine racemase [Gemmatimonadaceae bacterium]|nr:alanine racemase [Gemmatimonadaceae bacterium]
MTLDELETPAPVVDLGRMERNLDQMAAYSASHGLALRPHIKTHKTPWLAAEQLRRGAIGVTCATPREAEVMSDVADDVLVAYPAVGSAKARRIAGLPADVRLTVALDSVQAADDLADAARDAGRRVGVLVECDMGMRRVGVQTPEDALALVRHVTGRRELDYAGIAFYPGHIREPVDEQDDALRALDERLGRTLEALRRAKLDPAIVSGGSTPTALRTHEVAGVTEMRPGTYIFNDRTTAAIGACAIDECALTVLATVVSTAVPGQAVIDAGTKSLGREPMRGAEGEGFGVIYGREDVIVRAMSEEHGLLDLSRTDWRPAVGDRVRVIPNHVCIVVHLFDVVHGLRGETVETSWQVAARGRAAQVDVLG